MADTAIDSVGARTLPTPDELAKALEIEVHDRTGAKTPLADLVKGKRSILIFTRHFCTLN